MINDVEQLAAALPIRFRRLHLDKTVFQSNQLEVISVEGDRVKYWDDIRQHLALEILFFPIDPQRLKEILK